MSNRRPPTESELQSLARKFAPKRQRKASVPSVQFCVAVTARLARTAQRSLGIRLSPAEVRALVHMLGKTN